MTRGIWICSMVFVLVFAGGCNKQANDQGAIRASIDKHLSERSDLNMSAMDREVKQIIVNGDQASAQVEFRLKQGGGNMQVDYVLERHGGEWTVMKSQPAGGDVSHSRIDQPAGSNPQNGAQGAFPNFDDLLKNKPAQGNDSIPAGHPSIN